ncbi:MAG TPA: cystathionine beta-lyase [Burkholderiaceae bacterium]|nr:cystathionine beta-lyase [Burkholderiaceae bacterium]
MKPSTRLVTLGRDVPGDARFVNPPVVRGSTVLHTDVADLRERALRGAHGDDAGPVSYGIHGTPTHYAFLQALTELEGGYRSWALPSGLSACTVAILAFVGHGDHILVSDSAYGPTREFCLSMLPRYGIEATFYDPCIGAAIEKEFRPNTRLLFMESPGSLTFEVQDVPLLAQIARQHNAISVIDNTWATPLYLQPLQHGVDVSVHAVTKYIGGHADLLLGTITSNEQCWAPLRRSFRVLGLTSSPDDCWLALRGLRTLQARLERHRATAERLIDWLLEQPEVERVLYPARPEDPGHALWRRDFTGANGVFGVLLRSHVEIGAVHALIDGMRLFGRGYSWGGFESLLIPSYPQRKVTAFLTPGRLLRISAGLEDADDLINDLQQGFVRLRSAVG